MTEHRVNGILLAVEDDHGRDMIAKGVLDGEIQINDSRSKKQRALFDAPTPEQLILVPCPFVLDCSGIEGQYACADCDPPKDKADAIRKGWKDIEFDPFAAGASYLGVCPSCQARAQS